METLTEVVRSSKQIRIQGFSVTCAMSDSEALKLSRWNVGGYDWEVQLSTKSVALAVLYLRSEVRTYSDVKVLFSARLVDHSGKLKPHQGIPPKPYNNFKRSGDSCYCVLMDRSQLQTSGFVKDGAFTVEFTIEVLRELHRNNGTTRRPADDLVASTGLHHHLGELLDKGTGADVTLVAAGESFPAHKAILASRSPVFMAEFFGHMKETRSTRVEIKDMDAAVLGDMLRFIYTDSLPKPEPEDDGGGVVGAMNTAQHLLAAADRYGIDRLKLICEDRLYDGVSVDTAASILALAEQHGCCHLKARCVELIAENLEAVMATEGYKHLTASCPAVMHDLLVAVHGRKK